MIGGMLIFPSGSSLFAPAAATASDDRRKGDARIPSLREEDGDGEIWRRINLTEAEHGREAEERAMARVRRLRNL